MKILLSINPEYVEKIFLGEKLYEYRKLLPKKKISTVVIYATRPVSAIVGEFEVKDIYSFSPQILWDKTKQYSGVSSQFFFQYFKGKEIAHAFKVGGVVRYSEPKKLSDVLYSNVPPQSFCYLL